MRKKLYKFNHADLDEFDERAEKENKNDYNVVLISDQIKN